MTSGANGMILDIENVSKRYGAVVALQDVSLSIPDGGIFGLIGPNGSGKTTLFNVVTGVDPIDAGRIRLRGQDITARKSHDIARFGVARTFQNLRVFGRLTVFDNVLGAQTHLSDVRLWQQFLPSSAAERQRNEKVKGLLDMVGLSHRSDVLAQDLPLGEQRRLEIARSLAQEPDLLLLDEPAGGMTPQETSVMTRLIERIATNGRTVVLIEHKMGLVMRLCHRVAVLNFGVKIAEGAPADIQSDAAVREAYLGREPAHA